MTIKQSTLTNGKAGAFIALVLALIQVAAGEANGTMRKAQEQVSTSPVIRPDSQSAMLGTGADYRIGIGDVIEVTVDKAQELSGTYRITSTGTFEMYFLGRVVALNKTPEELTTVIADGLRGRYLMAPRVAVVVKQHNSHAVFVQGAVRSAGVYQLDGRVSLLKLISLCGGLADNHGSVAFIFREVNAPVEMARESLAKSPATPEGRSSRGLVNEQPPEYTFTPVNISGLLKGNLDENVMIEPHDIVNIPLADVFFVAGEVRAPGSFPLKPGTTLRQAISLAQGTTIQAATSRTMIFREDPSTGKRIDMKVDVGAVMEGRSEDLTIGPNDVIIIPNSKLKSVGVALLRSFGSVGQVIPRY